MQKRKIDPDLIRVLVDEGLSAQEIADRVGWTIGTLRVRCSQLKISLRRSGKSKAHICLAVPKSEGAWHSRPADWTKLVSTACKSNVERLMTFSTPRQSPPAAPAPRHARASAGQGLPVGQRRSFLGD